MTPRPPYEALVALLLACALVWLPACTEVDQDSSVPFEPPLLKTRDLKSVLSNGIQGPMQMPFNAEGEVPDGFAAVSFDSNAGTIRLSAQIALPNNRRTAIAVYGPRDAMGIWGSAIAHRSGAGPSLELDVKLPVPGRYMVLLGATAGVPGGSWTLSATCDGPCRPYTGPDADCPPENMQDCSISCPLGFRVDEMGCDVCACNRECVDELDCAEGEVCSPYGVCRPECQCTNPYEPVCSADGTTYANACEARCAGAEDFSVGACATMCPELACESECPNGYRLDATGCPTCECLSKCASCPATVQPVCTQNQRTMLNACQAQCAGERIAYLGVCRMSCAQLKGCDLDCGERGFAIGDHGCPICECQPSSECGVDGRVCVSTGATMPDACTAELTRQPIVYGGTCPTVTCRETADCPQGMACEIPSAEKPCLEGESGCLGVCLREQRCGSSKDDPCPSGYDCVDGMCRTSCMCASRYDPVCGKDGVTYDNACVAACAGTSVVRPGQCCPSLEACELDCEFGLRLDAFSCPLCECRSEPQCECTDIDSPVCVKTLDGQQLTYRNRCWAECDGFTRISDGPCP